MGMLYVKGLICAYHNDDSNTIPVFCLALT
jgi:hypothetical protein